MEKKIKDIYHCEPLDGYDPLVIWHNQVIEKSIDELTIADAARCIRQDLFIDKAYEALLAYLLHDPYAGDMYKGELMDKAGEVNDDMIRKHKKTIEEIVKNAEQLVETYDWITDEDKIDFSESVHRLKETLLW